MNIEYLNNETDLLNMHLYVLSQSKSAKSRKTMSQLSVSAICCLGGLFLLYRADGTGGPLFFLIGIAWYFVYPRSLRNANVKFFKDFIEKNQKSAMEKPTKLQFENDYLLIDDATEQLKVLLKAIPEIDETQTFIIIRFPEGTGILIPKERIAEAAAFSAYIKQLVATFNIKYVEDYNWKFK